MSTTMSTTKIPSPLMRLCILSNGLRISKKVYNLFRVSIKEPLRTRAGAAGGLDIILEDNSWVNAPVLEKFATESPYCLDVQQKKFVIINKDVILQKVTFPKRPPYYEKLTSDGALMSKVGVMLGDRLAISITNACRFWGTSDVCKYCSIGLNKDQDLNFKNVSEITETVLAAVSEGSANHVAISAGGLGGPDRGARVYAKYSHAIRKKSDVHIAAQLLPPEDLQYIDLLKNEGYSEVTYDMEIFNWDINWRISPGKAKIGLLHYIKTLERAVKVFGQGSVTSNLIVGPEPPESTAKGVEVLTQIGVIPKLIIFRPLMGTPLENEKPPSILHMIKTLDLSTQAAQKHGGKLGPSCVKCNINRLPVSYNGKLSNLYTTYSKYIE